MTHLHRGHVGWNLRAEGQKYVPTFPRARYWMSVKDWEACHQPDVQPARFVNAPTCVWPLAELGLIEFMQGEHSLTRELTALPTPGHTPGHEHPHHVEGRARARARRRRTQPGAGSSPTGFRAPTWTRS
jgi:glyoxylase-like metal-dependent hydrolase (beta-lactamase superfamily II)